MLAVANFVGSATLVTVIETEPEGTLPDAVYKPVAEIEPVSLGGPVTVQITAVLLVFATEAENCWVWPIVTMAVDGLTETDTVGVGGGSVGGGSVGGCSVGGCSVGGCSELEIC